ncbi:MAG: low affinity iron permease family protein [Gammaproteobacteria bacterium]
MADLNIQQKKVIVMNHLFHKFALKVSRVLGSLWALLAALLLIVAGGQYFGYTEKWTVESIVVILTFLMVFFLQHSQNIAERATHLKLDELIRAIEGARNEVVSVEDRAEDEIDELKQAIIEARDEAREAETEAAEKR